MRLALFDLDNTLLAGDSDYEWAQFLISQGVLEDAIYGELNRKFYNQYKEGTLNIYEFLEFQLQPLSRYSRQELNRWHAQYMKEKVLPMMTSAARALVAQHKAQGDLCAIVTATNSFVTRPISHEFGIEHLVATEPEEIGGEFTGKLVGTPCFREGKIIRVKEWLNKLGLTRDQFKESFFYSDSHNDIALLETVSHPVAVDPDIKLATYAHNKNWPVISLR